MFLDGSANLGELNWTLFAYYPSLVKVLHIILKNQFCAKHNRHGAEISVIWLAVRSRIVYFRVIRKKQTLKSTEISELTLPW